MEKHDCYFCAGVGCCVFLQDPVPAWAANSVHGALACTVMRAKKEKEEMAKQDKEEAYQRHCKEMDALDKAKEKDEISLLHGGVYDEGSPRMKRVREADEDGLDQHEPGAKLDHGKVDIYRHFMAMFPDAMACVAGVSDYGERKYSYMGWAKVSEGKRRYTAALTRHILDEARGEVYDSDPEKGSDLPHAAQAAWNALARLQLMIQDGDVEIRQGRKLNNE